MYAGSSLACPQYHHLHRDQAHSRLTSAITAPQTPRWRPPAAGDYASQPLTGTRRATLLGTCARARATRRHAPSNVVPSELVILTSRLSPLLLVHQFLLCFLRSRYPYLRMTMRRLLVFQHVSFEILGTLHPLLKQRGFRIRYANFGRHPHAKPEVDRYNGLVVLGGPMNVDDYERHPHLALEVELIRQAIEQGLPVLGICLGAQLVAGIARDVGKGRLSTSACDISKLKRLPATIFSLSSIRSSITSWRDLGLPPPRARSA